ncbi:hypothetical protein Drorol1_Dr00000510, partial [Drosera rotundifolia]
CRWLALARCCWGLSSSGWGRRGGGDDATVVAVGIFVLVLELRSPPTFLLLFNISESLKLNEDCLEAMDPIEFRFAHLLFDVHRQYDSADIPSSFFFPSDGDEEDVVEQRDSLAESRDLWFSFFGEQVATEEGVDRCRRLFGCDDVIGDFEVKIGLELEK